MELSVSFDLSVATCIWLSFLARIDISKIELWTASAVFLADQAHWSTLMLADDRALSSFVGLSPGDTVPPDLDLTKMDIKSLPWSGVSTPTVPILLLVQNVLHMALNHQKGKTPAECTTKPTPQMNDNMRHIRLLQETAVGASPALNAHIACLRAVLLLLKTVQLLLFIRVGFVKDSPLHNRVEAVCQGVTAATAAASAEIDNALSTHVTAAEQQEAEQLSVLLVKMALPVMKQMLKGKMLSEPFLHDWNCRVLTDLLPRNSASTVQAVAVEIISSGLNSTQSSQ